MNIFVILSLALKYLFRYRRRYIFLFFALALGFCIIAVIVSLKDGMAENVYFSAQYHYAGDIIFVGYDYDRDIPRYLDKKTIDVVLETISESKTPVERLTLRTLYNDNSVLFFNGESANLRYLNGVDWDNEAPYFNNLDYVGGGTSSLNDDSIILSEQIASVLKIRCGDNLIMELSDNYKRKNTHTFIVDAIVRDNTVFVFYKAFISRKTMNDLIGSEEDSSSTVGLFLKNKADTDKYKKILQKELSKKTLTSDLINTNDEFRAGRNETWKGVKVFIVTIPIYISDIYQILDALNLLSYFLYAMMLIIILVSASVTYNLILHERTKEIGTMRAIGFYENNIRSILIFETFMLGTLAIIAGFLLSLVITHSTGSLSFEWFPSFDIFLKNGRLVPLFKPLEIFAQIVAIYITLFLAVCVPTFRSSRQPLAEMLSGSMKG
jgi:ABC-type lipoprotein release transport system permease subunit